MARIVADRVQEQSTTTGTGSIVLIGAVTGYRTFNAEMANNDTCYYCIDAGTNNQWEIGIGTYTDTDLLFRTTVLENSLGTTDKIDFLAGTKTVSLVAPAVTQLPYFEQGTFTPTVTGWTPANITHTTQQGSYCRVGNLVFFRIKVAWTTSGGSTGSFKVASLPFVISGDTVFACRFDNFALTSDATFGNSYGQIYARGNDTVSDITFTTKFTGAIDMAASGTVYVAGTYLTT